MDQMPRRKFSLFVSLITFSLIPLFVSIAILCGMSSYLTKNNLESSVEKMLYVASNNLARYCQENQITAMNASNYYEYLDSLKGQKIEMAVIAEGMPCTTSIKNQNEYRVREIELSTDQTDLEKGYYDQDVLIDGKVYYGYYMPIHSDGKVAAMAFAGQLKETVTGSTRNMILSVVGVAFILVVIFLVVILFFCRNLSKSFTVATQNIDALSKGNLRKRESAGSSVKEMSNLLNSAGEMQKNISNTIGNVKGVSKKLVEDISEVTHLSDTSAGRAKQITSSVDGLTAATIACDGNVKEIGEQMMEIGTCINDISENVERLYQSSKSILLTNNEARENMKLIMGNNSKSYDAVNDISTQINDTNKSIVEIDKAVKLIIDISEQTNLLSLNASIEAARAGEYGRGFAVVAQEIRKLSDQSAEGAVMIKNLSKTIRENSKESVELADRLHSMILLEKDSISNTQCKYEKHSEDINHSVDEIQSITTKTEKLIQYKENVIRNVQRLGQISEDNSTSNQEVSANIVQIISEVAHVNEYCKKMNQIAEQLIDTVSFFDN